MYRVGLGDLGGRRDNYDYGLADFKIKEYMGTVTQADIDHINLLAYHAADARQESRTKGFGGAMKQITPYVFAVAISIATAGSATPAAIAWAAGTTAAKQLYMKKKLKKQMKEAQKKGAKTQAEIAALDADIAAINNEIAEIEANVAADKPIADQYAKEIKVDRGEQLKKALPFISLGLLVLRAF